MSATKQQEGIDRIFAALAEPNRRQILEHLASGGQSVETLARPLGASIWNTLKHIRILEEAGLIASEKVGRQRICYLKPDGLHLVTTWTLDLRNFWASNLGHLEAHLKNHD